MGPPDGLCPRDHVEWATGAETKACQQHSLDTSILENVEELIEDAPCVSQERAAMLQHWAQRANDLHQERSRFVIGLPNHVRPILGKMHVPLIAEMLEAAGHEDEFFLRDLQGGPVAGPNSGWCRRS